MNDSVSSMEVDKTYRYAGFWIRVAAGIIDLIIIFLMISIFSIFLKISTFSLHQTPSEAAIITFISLAYNTIVEFLYDACFISSAWQATPGMKAVGISVINYDGDRLSFGRSFLWSVMSVVSLLLVGIGYLMIMFNDKRQALHDKIAKAHLIYTR